VRRFFSIFGHGACLFLAAALVLIGCYSVVTMRPPVREMK
jgi:hypothetical protein